MKTKEILDLITELYNSGRSDDEIAAALTAKNINFEMLVQVIRVRIVEHDPSHRQEE